MSTIQSGVDTTVATVDPTSKALRGSLYDTSGNVITPADYGSFTPGTSPVLTAGGTDYKSVHAIRNRVDGSVATAVDGLLFFDPIEGAALNTNLWVSTLTTWTVATVASGVMTLNPGSTLTTQTGQLLNSMCRIPRYPRQPIVSRTRAKPGAHQANSIHEIGFGVPASAVAATVGDGAFWRKDASGQWWPVLSVNGTEQVGNFIADATFVASVAATEYAEFEIVLYDDRVEFSIETMGGVLVTRQVLNWNTSGNGVTNFASSHLKSMIRSYNNAAVSSAVQLQIAGHAVYQMDLAMGRSWQTILAAAGYGSVSHPTSFAQTSNFTNVSAPTTRTVTNTTALEATLGGHVSWNNAGTSFAGADTSDWVLFGYQAPSPYALLINNITVDTVNLGAANAAAPYTIEYAISTNLSAVSLATAAPNGPRFQVLGFMTLAASAAIGIPFSGRIQQSIAGGLVIQPGNYFHLVARVLAGTATASQVIRTTCLIDGYWV